MTELVNSQYLETFTDTFGKTKTLKHRFHRESRTRYHIDKLEDLFVDDNDLLLKFIKHHKTVQRPRLIELMDYSQAMNHEVSQDEFRRNETDMSDARAIHDFGGMVSTFKEGYLTGVPIRVNYDTKDKESKINQQLQDVAKINGFDKLNRLLVLDMSRVGRAYEMVYRRSDDKTIVRKLSPFDTFVIFDRTASVHSLCAVRYYNVTLFDNSKEIVEVYTNDKIHKFELTDGKLKELKVSPELHSFGMVPITEYLNDEFGFGDYEKVLSLIDLYDAAQSDTANYMADLSDAILGIFGNLVRPDGMNEKQFLEFQKAMRKARLMLFTPPVDNDGREAGSVDAKYLTKSYDVAGTESYKTRVENDIHKFTNMPNLNDSNFSGQQSGESLKYKLFGLDQKITDTKDMLIESLKRRYELIAAVGNKVNEIDNSFDASNLDIVITPNLPKAMSEMIANLKAMGGIVSIKTALEKSGLIDDVTEELKRIDDEGIGQLPTYDGE